MLSTYLELGKYSYCDFPRMYMVGVLVSQSLEQVLIFSEGGRRKNKKDRVKGEKGIFL